MNAKPDSILARAVDQTVALFSPGAALQRKLDRERLKAFRYDAAVASRNRSGVVPALQSPESGTYQMDRVKMMKLAIELAENSPLAAGVLDKFEAYVVGKLGYQARTGDRDADNKIEAYLSSWFQRCDRTGRHSFERLAQLGLRGALVCGDSGYALTQEKGSLNKSHITIEGIEGDRIGNPNQTTNDPAYVSGIVLDKTTKRPTHYHIYNRTLSGGYEKQAEIAADHFFHLFKARRFDEYRGVTAFHAVLNTIRDIDEIIAFEKVAVKWGSAQAGVVAEKNSTGANSNEFFNDGEHAGTGTAKRIEEVLPGRINYIDTSGTFSQFKIDRPGAAWEGFIQLLIKLYAVGMNLPPGFVFEMLGTGPATRFEGQMARRTFTAWQNILTERVLDPIKARVLLNAVNNGELHPFANITRGRWQFPSHPTIDVGRESRANVDEHRAGLKSMATILGPESLDDSEEREQIVSELADWLRLGKEKGVPVELLPPFSDLPQHAEPAEEGAEPPRISPR